MRVDTLQGKSGKCSKCATLFTGAISKSVVSVSKSVPSERKSGSPIYPGDSVSQLGKRHATTTLEVL